MFDTNKALIAIESLTEKIMAQGNVIENLRGSNQALSEQNELLRKEIRKLKSAEGECADTCKQAYTGACAD